MGERAKVLVVVENGMADASHAGEVDVLVIDLDLQDEDELDDERAQFTDEWRAAFPELAVQYNL